MRIRVDGALEEHEAIDHHFTSVVKEVSIYFCFWNLYH